MRPRPYRLSSIVYSLFVVHALACSLSAQTTSILKDKNNRLIDSLKVPSGKTFTIESGATINATGATITGFTASSAWADITGKPSTFPPEAHNQAWSTITSTPTTLAGYGIADAITAATAASTYASLSGTYANPSWITSLAWSKLTSIPANVTAFGNLANASGVLTNNGSGTLSYTGTSNGGDGAGSDGKLAAYSNFLGSNNGSLIANHLFAHDSEASGVYTQISPSGTLRIADGTHVTEISYGGPGGNIAAVWPTSAGTMLTTGSTIALSQLATTGTITATQVKTANAFFPTRYTELNSSGVGWYNVSGSGFNFTLTPSTAPTIDRTCSFNPNGNLVSTADTGTVTSTMLAGSIALSKLALTGTPDGTKFIRDDGSYQAINLSGYLPLSGGTLTGALVITQGTANTGLLSSTGYSLTGSNATPAIDIAGTLNTSGNPAVMQVAMTTTAAGSTTALARFLGTTSGSANVFAVLAPVANAQASAAFQIGAGLFCGEYAASSEWWFGFSNNKFAGKFAIDTIGAKVANNGYYAFGNDTFANSSADLLLRRDAAARLQLGTDAASPISQQVKSADGVGTNIAASNLTLGGSTSTGTGAGGDVVEVTSMSGSSGSSANATQTRRQTIGRFVNLIEGTATNVASIALPSGKVVGGTATITVWASDGTDHQVITRDVSFNAANKAGTISSTSASGLSAASTGAGSLSFTFDTAASGNNLLLRANATSELTQTILRCRLVITALNGDDVQTVTPQ